MGTKYDTLHCTAADFPVQRTRHLRFVELWKIGDWEIKAYLQSAHRDELPDGYLVRTRPFIEGQLSTAEGTKPAHRIGFVILSHGAISNWVMFDWWSSLHLYQRIFQVEGMPPDRFVAGPLGLFQCVYDLRITAFESEAWRKHVVENPRPDIQAYLAAQLRIDV